MANTAGGNILLGVRDDGTVKGFPDSNEQRARIQDIARNCDPPVKVLVQRAGEVTVVTVRESDAKPVQSSDGFFWRQGAVTQKLSRDEAHDPGCPEPIFEENGFFTAIFHPNPKVRAQADTRQELGTAQVPPQVPPKLWRCWQRLRTASPAMNFRRSPDYAIGSISGYLSSIVLSKKEFLR